MLRTYGRRTAVHQVSFAGDAEALPPSPPRCRPKLLSLHRCRYAPASWPFLPYGGMPFPKCQAARRRLRTSTILMPCLPPGHLPVRRVSNGVQSDRSKLTTAYRMTFLLRLRHLGLTLRPMPGGISCLVRMVSALETRRRRSGPGAVIRRFAALAARGRRAAALRLGFCVQLK